MEQSLDIQALKAGDERAFKELVESFQDRVFNTCLGFLETREEAEDAAQETFMEVYANIQNFREEAQLSTWVYRIAVTKSLQMIRKKKSKKRFALFYTGEQKDGLLESVPDTSGQYPLQQLINKEEAKIIYDAMKHLSEAQRVAFTLHKIEELEYKEISSIMDLSVSSVESLIHRAKTNLKKRLYVYYRTHAANPQS